MASVNGALRSSLTLPEMEQQGVWDDICCKPAVDEFVSQNSTVSAEDLFVDDLLDFSKAEAEEEYDVCETKDIVNRDKIEDETFHISPLNDENLNNHLAAVHETELCVPTDDLTNLEWLSNITDDSAPGYSLTMPAAKFPVKTAGKVSDTEVNGTEKCSVTKARSKRAKNGVRVWPHCDSSTSSSSSSYASSSSPLRTWIMYKDVGHSDESLIAKPPAKKQKNLQEVDTTATGGALVPPRRCSHCLVQKTPQWRAGPMGAKTLCNACGVRYKSGRLLPEYRPACSPTFSIEKHSNNHRKVMEMRRKKEGDGGFATPVESF